MDKSTKNRYEVSARIMKALAHPTRLFIVEQLLNQTRCVTELTEMIGTDISTVSRHLAILKNIKLVIDEKCGTQIYYSLRYPCVMSFFPCIESVIKEITSVK